MTSLIYKIRMFLYIIFHFIFYFSILVGNLRFPYDPSLSLRQGKPTVSSYDHSLSLRQGKPTVSSYDHSLSLRQGKPTVSSYDHSLSLRQGKPTVSSYDHSLIKCRRLRRDQKGTMGSLCGGNLRFPC
jgi:hypothetical protein